MKQEYALLQALKCALRGETTDWAETASQEEWTSFFSLAAIHNVLPMTFEAVYRCDSFRKLPEPFQRNIKGRVLREAARQASRSEQFARLYETLREGGVEPLVVKGAICRSLYPKPDARPSHDEDWLIDPEQFGRCDALLLANGLQRVEEDTDASYQFEVTYYNRQKGLYLELHKSLFEPGSGALKNFDRYFSGVAGRAILRSADGVAMRTLSGHDHLLYLLLHAFKHFIHSGFGIRQICDIILWAEAYGPQIDWPRLLEQCRALDAADFAAAIFRIGVEELGFDIEKACYPSCWRAIPVETAPMLQDVLTGGVYGKAQESRLHSSTMTVNAVEAARNNRTSSVLQSVFPSVRQMEGRFPYLKKYPVLLPVAWGQRIARYGREVSRSEGKENAAASVGIGRQRIELLRLYKIIK
ncbi:MAG: nucleotidyltransferase family protein [Gemmiger sp.]